MDTEYWDYAFNEDSIIKLDSILNPLYKHILFTTSVEFKIYEKYFQ